MNTTECLRVGRVFKFEYSLKANEITRFTTNLGYFHDLERLVVASNLEEAMKTLTTWHTDGKPEAVKATELGVAIKLKQETQ